MNYINDLPKKAYVKFKDLEFEVEVKDYKNSYGNARYLVSPVAGRGEKWVEDIIEIK